MKGYFAASFRGIKHYSIYYQQIYKSIEECSLQHIEKTLLKNTEEIAYQKLENGGVNAYATFFDETIKNIKASDINFFDCTMPSLGVGFQVEKSLEYNKPTIVLYLKDHLPHFIAGTHDDKLILKEYTEKNIPEVVKRAIEEAKEITDKRFNFFISPALLSYLEGISKRKSITKSAFIRQLIQDYMRKNPS